MNKIQDNDLHDVSTRPRLYVVGVGGAGGNAVNNMLRSQQLDYVNFVVCNTDAQALEQSPCENRIQLGAKATRGLGAGSSPEVGKQAAEESLEEVMTQIEDAHMVFVVGGMGGGTGTGAAPVIAKTARDRGILTVGVVTMPFSFEGRNRCLLAEHGIEEMRNAVHTLLVIPNQNLFRLATNQTTIADAFAMADSVLFYAVQMISDLMTKAGLINLDYADLRAVMTAYPGEALIGTGQAEDPVEAAEKAIFHPLLEGIDISSAKALIINITGGLNLKLHDVDAAVCRVKKEVQDSEVLIIVGAILDANIGSEVRVAAVAVGINQAHGHGKKVVQEVVHPQPEPLVENPQLAVSEVPQFQETEPLKPAFDFNLDSLVPLGNRHDLNYGETQFDLEHFSLREPESPFETGHASIPTSIPFVNPEPLKEKEHSSAFPAEEPPHHEKHSNGLGFFERWTNLGRKVQGRKSPLKIDDKKKTFVSPAVPPPFSSTDGTFGKDITRNTSFESLEDEQHIPPFLRNRNRKL